MYTHFVFDVDGTIINSDETWDRVIRIVMKDHLSRSVTKADLQAIRGKSDDDMLAHFQITDSERQAVVLSRQLEIYLQEYHRNHYYEGIIECLNLLKARGRALGICTNRVDFELREPLWIDLSSKMDVIVTGEMVRRKKPDPEPLIRYLERAQVERSQVLFIGDTANDAECAAQAGVDFALALWGTHDRSLTGKYRFENPLQLAHMVVSAKETDSIPY